MKYVRDNYLNTPQLTGPSDLLWPLWNLGLEIKFICLRLAKLKEDNFSQNSIISKLHLIFPFCFSIHMRIEREAAGNGPLPVQTQNGHSTSGVKRVSFGGSRAWFTGLSSSLIRALRLKVHVRKSAVLRFEPGAARWKALTLVLCYADDEVTRMLLIEYPS